MRAADLASQGLPDGELLACVLLVLVPLALITIATSIREMRGTTIAAAAPVPVPVPPRATTCNAHRPHIYHLTADGTAHVCVRCQERVERGVGPALPFDQQAAELVAETEAVLRQVAGGAA